VAEKPSDFIYKSLTISDVGQKFEKQGANDLYNLNNQFEDLQCLFVSRLHDEGTTLISDRGCELF